MSTEENTIFLENLQGRVTDMLPHLTPGSIADFERYIAENDWQGAEALVDTLEALYADDLTLDVEEIGAK